MCIFSPPKAPQVPTIRAPQRGDGDIQSTAEEERRLARIRGGRHATILTGGLGDSGFARVGGRRPLLGD